ncbi:MAG: PhnE/PtxC family ABC transporter permease, partial [Beijerinckiaceae bacterium]
MALAEMISPAAGPSLWKRLAFVAALVVGVACYGLFLHVADVSPSKLAAGLPRLFAWLARAWPPDLSELDTLAMRGLETVAKATVGVSFGAVIAAPICLLAASNITTSVWLNLPARWILNTLRGIDSFVFALIFVAAVGLGPQLRDRSRRVQRHTEHAGERAESDRCDEDQREDDGLDPAKRIQNPARW